MSENLDLNLDEITDYRFLEIDAELSVLVECARAAERQLPLTIESESSRLEAELNEADEYERYTTDQWIYQFTEEVLPRFFRAPILIALWAIFESAVIRIADYLRVEGRHALKIDDLRGRNDFDRYQKYYEQVLRFPLIGSDELRDRLEILLLVRNALAHGNGRIEMIKPQILEKIRHWEKVNRGIATDLEYLGFTASFVATMIDVVSVVLNDLIKRVKENT